LQSFHLPSWLQAQTKSHSRKFSGVRHGYGLGWNGWGFVDVFFGGPGFGCKIKGAEVEVVDFVV